MSEARRYEEERMMAIDADEFMTLDEIVALAKERGVPGPDVAEHEDGYDDECYCWSCLEYMQ
jgi:hypothetical protein